MENDLAEHRLDGRLVLRRVIHEDARSDKGERRRGTHHRRDAGWSFTLPVWADHQVEAGLGAVGLADLGEFIRARIVQRIHPEAIAEIRYLKDDRFLVEGHKPRAVNHVLVWAGDEMLFGANV